VSSEHPWLLIIAPGLRYVRLWLNLLDGMVALASGILDRIDSVCFAAPIFFHLTRYFFTR
jgi:predicted CDP-diglyceride synthetase/phosphatidate cytidylyltransferase